MTSEQFPYRSGLYTKLGSEIGRLKVSGHDQRAIFTHAIHSSQGSRSLCDGRFCQMPCDDFDQLATTLLLLRL